LLSAEVAGILEGYTQRRKTVQAFALRARIVLGPDDPFASLPPMAHPHQIITGISGSRHYDTTRLFI
jgi:hypothetical protein